eukprot:TRINITY_DN9396_c0_g2_i1.p1 TRINITY_DN9396_c0_g2~~TRINITY_DN9396_c0_g2_i1.p1  ORF type:complete len:161 (-),score=27.50 TRINITY_DN9396_c0_g2_i1:142-624(-)
MNKGSKNQERFVVKRQLGQGTFSMLFILFISIGTIYSAYDNYHKELVALKVENLNKPKRILALEYQILLRLQGIFCCAGSLEVPHICKVYDFVKNVLPEGRNFIVMQMLGKNLASVKKAKGQCFSAEIALKLLVYLLCTISFKSSILYKLSTIKGSFIET